MPKKQHINEHLYADEIGVNDNLAVEGGRNVVGSVSNALAGFQTQHQKRSSSRRPAAVFSDISYGMQRNDEDDEGHRRYLLQ